MNRKKIYIPTVFAAGLMTSQALSFLQVFLSDLRYYDKIRLIHESGYMGIPNLIVLESLKSPETAFRGGLFFCLTVGFGLCILSFAAAWLWDRIFLREKKMLYPFLFFWISCLLCANIQGFSPLLSLHFLMVPSLVFLLTVRLIPPSSDRRTGRIVLFHVICLLLLAVLGAKCMNTRTFSIIRDRLLLSGPVGIFLNDAYYRSTLYAAQVFKNLYQDQMRTCRIGNPDQIRNAERLKRQLARYDYLAVRNTEKGMTDMEISGQGAELIFRQGEKEILRYEFAEFFKNSGKILKEFSEKTDRHGFFRSFTFVSLLLVSGLSCWMLLWLPVRMLCGFICSPSKASFLSLSVSFLAVACFLLFWQPGQEKKYDRTELNEMLHSPEPDERIAALRSILHQKMEIAGFRVHESLAVSPHIPERYQLVRTLSVSRSPDTYAVLLALADDPQINVAYLAFHALGERKEPRAIPEIRKRLEKSSEWYIQLYAYKALKKLGWTQTVPNL